MLRSGRSTTKYNMVLSTRKVLSDRMSRTRSRRSAMYVFLFSAIQQCMHVNSAFNHGRRRKAEAIADGVSVEVSDKTACTINTRLQNIRLSRWR